jgi:hypothetical protein
VWCGSNAGTGRTFVLCSTDSCTMGLICSSRSVSMTAGVQEVEGAGGGVASEGSKDREDDAAFRRRAGA